MDLLNYFDRVVVINLRRRPDRLARFKVALRDCRWPFKQPVVFEAVDGSVVPPPEGWQSGPGAWGCMKSHQLVLDKAIADGVKNLLVLEDDVCFVDGFRDKAEKFLRAVPEDWDQLMFGGQHQNLAEFPPIIVKPGIYRCIDCERTHCYGIRGTFMQRLLHRWRGGGKFNGMIHCDHIMGRDPDMQRAYKTYAPKIFIAGQQADKSDINHSYNQRQIWIPPGPDLPVIYLHASRQIAVALREYGFHTGFSRDPESDFDTGLQAIFKVTVKDPSVREHQLREWIKSIQWEVATFPRLICTVWHPEATQELVKAASLWRVYPITADSLSCALNQIPHKYRRSHQPILASRFIVHLTAPREVMKELRLHGWHDGHNLDQLTEENLILVRIWQLFTDHQMRIQQLSVALKRLQIEAERRENGLAVVWHHQINSSTVREATSTQVLDIHAETVADALSHLKSAIPNAIYIESKIQSCSNCQS